MASRKFSDLDPRLQSVWFQAVGVWNTKHPALVPFLTCTHRPNEEQDGLYEVGRSMPGNIVTNAKAGESAHNPLPACALDMAFKKPDGSVDWSIKHYKNFAAIVKTIDPGIVWGGKWETIKDYPHFELPDWKSMAAT